MRLVVLGGGERLFKVKYSKVLPSGESIEQSKFSLLSEKHHFYVLKIAQKITK